MAVQTLPRSLSGQLTPHENLSQMEAGVQVASQQLLKFWVLRGPQILAMDWALLL